MDSDVQSCDDAVYKFLGDYVCVCSSSPDIDILF